MDGQCQTALRDCLLDLLALAIGGTHHAEQCAQRDMAVNEGFRLGSSRAAWDMGA